jgi:hypothetical protein
MPKKGGKNPFFLVKKYQNKPPKKGNLSGYKKWGRKSTSRKGFPGIAFS